MFNLQEVFEFVTLELVPENLDRYLGNLKA